MFQCYLVFSCTVFVLGHFLHYFAFSTFYTRYIRNTFKGGGNIIMPVLLGIKFSSTGEKKIKSVKTKFLP